MRSWGLGVLELCEAEVENLHLAVGQQEDVGGLQVPVRDALLVRRAESARDRDRDVHRLAHRQRALPQAIGERLAVQEFGDHEERVAVEADVEEGEDIGVRESCYRVGFALEPGAAVRVAGHVRRQHLDGDVAAEARIARAVHLAHAAGPKGGRHFVGAEPCSGAHRHRRVRGL